MAETEVFRIEPVVNKCYEHAEYTRKEGRYPNERYFTNIPPRYVGEYIRSERGGWGDGGWKTDYFRDLDGIEKAIDYSYEGRTSFREVPCGQPTTQTGGKFKKYHKRSNKKTNKKRRYKKSRKSRKNK
jgi:hypothetical protein